VTAFSADSRRLISRPGYFRRALCAFSLAWPVLVIVGLELALRLAPWIDPLSTGVIDLRAEPAVLRFGGRRGYIVVGQLSLWMVVGVVLSIAAVLVVRETLHRRLAIVGGLLDMALLCYANAVRF
jgi:hypothetical protein